MPARLFRGSRAMIQLPSVGKVAVLRQYDDEGSLSMRAWRPYLFGPFVAIVAALPGCSGCSSEQVMQPQPSSASESEPRADSAAATESSEQSKTELGNSNQNETTPEPAEGVNESNRASESLPEKRAPSGSATGSLSGVGIAPEAQIQQWLEAARREQRKGQPGKAFVYAADASGLLRKVKDARQRQSLQTQVDEVLAAVEPVIERKTKGTDTLADSKPLIEK